MEPTDNELHAGCVGNINATWAFRGRSGHSARPWQAENAITAAALGVAALASAPIQPVTFEGLTFYEVASVTRIAGGIAMNVIPETCTAHVNFRYAPGRTPERGRGAAAGAHRRPGRADDHRQLRLGRRRRRPPAGAEADRDRRAARRAQAGVDAGGRVRRGRLRRGQLRPGRARAGAPARRVDRDRGAAALLRGPGGLRVHDRPPLPRPGRTSASTRSCGSSEAKARLRATAST